MASKQKRWRLVLTIITFLALAGLIFAVRKQIGETINNIGRINAAVLLLMPLWQIINYHAYTKMYQHIFKIIGHKVAYKPMLRTQLELNFVNNVFPSGGVSGISFFGVKMKSLGVSPGKATLVQVMKFVLIFLTLQVLVFFGLIVLAAAGKASNLVILVAGSLSTFLALATAIIAYVIGSKDRIRAFFTLITQGLNRVIYVVRPKHPETINVAKVQEVFTELHENYMLLKGNWNNLKMPAIWALVANLTEILTIYTVYMAFANFVNIGAVILAYVVANVSGLVSVLPGGVGIYEAIMTAVLVAVGVPAGISIPVTIMYRMLNMMIQLPPGYYFYHKTINQKS